MAVVEQAATDTATAATPLTFEPVFTDPVGAAMTVSLNDNLTTVTQATRASDAFSVDKSASVGGSYTSTHYPYTAVVVFPTHTFAEVLSYEDVKGAQGE